MRYRKRPVVIEAWRWMFTNAQEKSPTWVDDALGKWPDIGGIAFEPEHKDGPRISIATLDAVALAFPGDWIVKGVQGELYPCKNDIFEATYEKVEGAYDYPAHGSRVSTERAEQDAAKARSAPRGSNV